MKIGSVSTLTKGPAFSQINTDGKSRQEVAGGPLLFTGQLPQSKVI
ncbi:MAG: hypothetical protein WDO68_22850 [Gammaproteobacteria bacterium]